MNHQTHFLVAIDFTQQSESALQEAILLAASHPPLKGPCFLIACKLFPPPCAFLIARNDF